MSELDPVQRLLADRGCPDDVVAAGLDGLVSRWSSIVASVEAGYRLGLDDLLNDLDTRDALSGALVVARPAERASARAQVDALDARLRAVSVASPCLWGDDVEEDDGLSPQDHWWYYRRPSRLNDDLAAELAAWGLLHDPEDPA